VFDFFFRRSSFREALASYYEQPRGTNETDGLNKRSEGPARRAAHSVGKHAGENPQRRESTLAIETLTAYGTVCAFRVDSLRVASAHCSRWCSLRYRRN